MIHIACAADEAYTPHCAAMMQSAFTHHPADRVNIHFMHPEEYSSVFLDMLRDMINSLGGKISFHAIPAALVSGLPAMERIPKVMWYRIFLPEILRDIDRVLYLDCDTLIMDDLASLWNTRLDDSPLAAVSNIFPQNFRHHGTELGLEKNSHYFNSGVLLLNLSAWRNEQITDQILSYVDKNQGTLLWPDQDALNAVLADKSYKLDPRWNCQNSFYFYPHACQVFSRQKLILACHNPGILHFEGPAFAKPWHIRSTHPFRKEYFLHRKNTPWPEVHLSGDRRTDYIKIILDFLRRRNRPLY